MRQGDSQRVPTLALAVGLVGSVLAAAHCSTPPAPSPPSAEPTHTETSTATTTNTSSATATASDTGTDNSTATVPATANFNPGGAAVGSDADKANVQKCLAGKTFYDRFANDGAGTCTKFALAPVDCNDAGIQGILTDKQKSEFDNATTGTGPFVSWLIDQCLDCPAAGGVPYCQKNDGTTEIGTKVYYVQEQNNTLQGQSLCLPVRPGFLPLPDGEGCGAANATATSTGTTTTTGTGTGTGT